MIKIRFSIADESDDIYFYLGKYVLFKTKAFQYFPAFQKVSKNI